MHRNEPFARRVSGYLVKPNFRINKGVGGGGGMPSSQCLAKITIINNYSAYFLYEYMIY